MSFSMVRATAVFKYLYKWKDPPGKISLYDIPLIVT